MHIKSIILYENQNALPTIHGEGKPSLEQALSLVKRLVSTGVGRLALPDSSLNTETLLPAQRIMELSGHKSEEQMRTIQCFLDI